MSEINFIYESPVATRCLQKFAAKSTDPEKFKYYWRVNLLDNNLCVSEFWEDFGALNEEALGWFARYIKKMIKHEKKTGTKAPVFRWVALEEIGFYDKA